MPTLYPPDDVRFLVFWVTVAGVIVICLYGVEESKLLIKELDDVSRLNNDDDDDGDTDDDDDTDGGVQVFKRLIYEWDNDPRASRIVTQIQEYVGCCGARRN